MNIRLLWLVLVIGITVSIGAKSSGSSNQPDAALNVSLPPLPRSGKILAFGDSLTFGVGGSGTTYPQRLSQLIGREVVNAGIPGETSEQGRERLALTIREVKPALVILCLGTNDYLRRLSPAALRANLQAMVDETSAAAIPVLLLAVPSPMSGKIDPWFALLSRESQVRVDQHAMADVLRQSALKSDLIHPDSDGYRQIADAVARSLKDSGALTSTR